MKPHNYETRTQMEYYEVYNYRNYLIWIFSTRKYPKKTKQPKLVYISGKITGIEHKAPQIFKNAEIELQFHGYKTINPLKLNHNHDKTWKSYMKVCIKSLTDCDTIYMLKNWYKSKGAIVELLIAKILGLTIKFQ